MSSTALAQTAVAVRSGNHDGYTRLVFNWPAPTSYNVEKTAPDKLSIIFDRAATLDTAGVALQDSPFVKKIEQGSADGKTSVALTIAPDTQFRHFMTGNRILIDISGAQAASAPAKPAATPKTDKPAAPEAKPVPEKPKSAPEETKPAIEPQAGPATAPAAKPVADAAKTPVPSEARKEETPPAQTQPAPEKAPVVTHSFTFSSTEATGMAVFTRGNRLWLVFDRADIKLPPKITSPQPDMFAPMVHLPLKNGVAYVTEMKEKPAGNIYGSGGGLVWQIDMTTETRDVKPAGPERSWLPDQAFRGGLIKWPLKSAAKILEVPDPYTGDVLKVVTVNSSNDFSGPDYDFVDFGVMRSPIGMTVKSKVDDLAVTIAAGNVNIGRPSGLALAPLKDINRRLIREQITESTAPAPSAQPEGDIKRIYDFERWQMGGIGALKENQRILMAGAAGKDTAAVVQNLLTMAKMNVANDRGPEALGLLSYAEQLMPVIADGDEYRALRGAAYALSGKYEMALQDLMVPTLAEYTEVNYWKAYTLAWLEDWKQAAGIMPKDYDILLHYPSRLLEKVGVKLAEVALRAGDVKAALAMLDEVQKYKADIRPWTTAGLNYLRGEASRQKGDMAQARVYWEPLIKGRDDFYRARAGAALTLMELQDGKINREQAIDRLEGLRYAWRGDELESRINFTLGRLYVEDRRYLKGFGILKEAADLTPNSDISRDIHDYMSETFAKLLFEDKDLSPLDAVTLHEEFPELTPEGEAGDKLVQKLAERLENADLLDRAASILQNQTDRRLSGTEKARVSMRLGAVYLLNDQADKAMKALDTARTIYSTDENAAANPQTAAQIYRIDLMRARALSQMGKTEEALLFLGQFPRSSEVNRLRADIAWQANAWADAAEALGDLIVDDDIDPAKPLTADQADMLLNRAVALNLSNNRVALATIRERYGVAMTKTARAKLFDVVTRPRQITALSGRETLQSIVSEVDIFKGFLETYRDADTPEKTPAPASAAPEAATKP